LAFICGYRNEILRLRLRMTFWLCGFA
jgi:hypothetical protein